MDNLRIENKELQIKIKKKKAHEIFLVNFFHFEILFLILYKIIIASSMSIILTENFNIKYLIIISFIFFLMKFIFGIYEFFSSIKKDEKFKKLFLFEISLTFFCLTFFLGLIFDFTKKNYQIIFFLFHFLALISLLLMFDHFSNKKNIFSVFFFFFYLYQFLSVSIFLFKFENFKSFDWSLNFFNLSIFPTIIILVTQFLKVIYTFNSNKIVLPKVFFFFLSYVFFYFTNSYMIKSDNNDEFSGILDLKFMLFLFLNFYLSFKLYFIEKYINWINLEKNIEYSLIFKNKKIIQKLDMIQKSHNFFGKKINKNLYEKEEKKKLNIENCFICFSKPLEIICKPCLHAICCQECFIDFFKIQKFHCIFCKKKIKSGIRFQYDKKKNLFNKIGSFKIFESFSDYFIQ